METESQLIGDAYNRFRVVRMLFIFPDSGIDRADG